MRVIVLGYVIRCPLGGLVWHYLQYVVGLARLGFDVYYMEDSCFFESDDVSWCYDPVRKTYGDPSFGFEFIHATLKRFGLEKRWAYYDASSAQWYGPCSDQAYGLCETSDLLLNVSGANPLRPWLRAIPVRCFVDTDPIFTQIRQLTNPINRELAFQHNAFFSFGENIGRKESRVPADTITWHPTRQPVVLDAWPVEAGPDSGRFTTVMAWDSYKTESYDGTHYGMKSRSFDAYWDLPSRVDQTLEMALFDVSAPPEDLRRQGWLFRDASSPTKDIRTYQRYIRDSKGEFSVAKHGYVISDCGWFSERSTCYLASGRPVIIQDTGFSSWLDTGSGVVAFTTLEEAVEAIENVSERYDDHCKSAREIAEAYFDARKVLPRVIEGALDPTCATPAPSADRPSASHGDGR